MVDLVISESIREARGAKALHALATWTLEQQWFVVADFSLFDEGKMAAVDRCWKIGVGGPADGALKAIDKFLPGRHPTYFTCEIRSIIDLDQSLELSELTREFRIRAYEKAPSSEEMLQWTPSEIESSFLDTAVTSPMLVAMSQNDETQLLVRCDSRYEKRIRSRLNI